MVGICPSGARISSGKRATSVRLYRHCRIGTRAINFSSPVSAGNPAYFSHCRAVYCAADKKNLFEIGCAHGFFLALAEKKFHSAEGIDISSDAIKYAHQILGVNATSSEFLTHEFVRAPAVVCMWDTIEHVRRPDLYIEKIANTIPKGGLLAVTTADLDSWVARARGSKWRQIHPPTHLHYFSRKTLSRLLDRNGLEIKYIGSEGMYRRVETMAYIILCLKQNRPILYNCLRKTGLLDWDLYLNLGDIVFTIAEKV
jgi:SAM-dependent methyltransferase